MTYFTPCRICGKPTVYQSRRLEGKITCDNPECKAEAKRSKSQKLKNTAATKTLSPRAPCRVCGGPTRFRADSLQASIRICDNPKCIAESRRRKNEAIRAT